ncbi:hypothetical protein BJX66DRAFT_49812 [Aspergillus keveii]|uniref:Uncharacterized protein n=1 Tax=Aspergillus keveii TaxID=714993 RepID=A0ABR4FRD7_9EURO
MHLSMNTGYQGPGSEGSAPCFLNSSYASGFVGSVKLCGCHVGWMRYRVPNLLIQSRTVSRHVRLTSSRRNISWILRYERIMWTTSWFSRLRGSRQLGAALFVRTRPRLAGMVSNKCIQDNTRL